MPDFYCMGNYRPLSKVEDTDLIHELFSVKIFVEENFLSPEQCAEFLFYAKNEDRKEHKLIYGEGKSSHAKQPFFNQIPNRNKIISAIQNRIDFYSNSIGMNSCFFDVNTSWCNIQQLNSSLQFHAHTRSQITGVIFIHVDSNSAPLQFINPNYGAFYHDNGDIIKPTNTPIVSYRPKNGDLILFPSWLVHGNINNQTNNRTVISFNCINQVPIKGDL